MNSPSLTDLSSDLSSVGSLSPPPPIDYPSPPSSQNCTSDDSTGRKRSRESDEQEPGKKKRKSEPKPRTTQYLDLQSQPATLSSDQISELDTLSKVLRQRKKIVVIAGAGISVSAGIPDFRSASGLFTTLKNEHNLKASGKQLFDASVYQTDSATTSFHSMVRGLSQLASKAKPTAFHHLLATLGEQGRLMRLYTQNVDGIDTSLTPLATSVPLASKGPWPRTIQLHGGLEKMVCSKCNHLSDFEPALFEGPLPPLCTHCVETDRIRTNHAGKRSHGIGRLRPRIVLYNEHNPDDEAIGTVVSSDLRARPDAVIVVGTSMKIPGVRRIVREMCGVVRSRRDGIAVWVNHDPPPIGKEFEDCWDLVVKGSSDDVATFAKMRHWDDDGTGVKDCTESDAERAVQEQGIQVVIESPKKTVTAFMPTPAASPAPKPCQPQSKLKFSKLQHVEIPAKRSELSKTSFPSNKNTTRAKPKGRNLVGRPESKASNLQSNGRIDNAYKITKPRQPLSDGVEKQASLSSPLEDGRTQQMPSDNVKHRVPLFSTYQNHFALAPVPTQAPWNNGPLPNGIVKPALSPLKVRRSFTPQDFELRGPEKVVLASMIADEDDEFPDMIASTRRSLLPKSSSPLGRPPNGIAMLLN
ncbi:MAG: hypothetical protein Q9201_007805 [Fulgogasparrea decipioides]